MYHHLGIPKLSVIHTIAQVSLITQSVARRYGWVQRGGSSGFDELPGKFITSGVSEDLCDGRKGMKKTIEEIAFSLHVLEERKVLRYKSMYPDAEDIGGFREKTYREIGENHSGDRFWCPGGTYPKLQLILNDIRSSESFESLLIFAKRQFAENLVSERLNAIGLSGQSTHIVPYVINTIARDWGLEEKDSREDEYVGFYDNLPRDFTPKFQTELDRCFKSESFIRVITESLPSKIMEKTVVDLPSFSEYEDSGGWITIIGADNEETEAGKNIRRSQDDYIADIISVFSRFGINGYFGEGETAQRDSIQALLFKNTTVSRGDVVITMKVEVISYDNLLMLIQFACMYKMASYDPPLISGVSKEVFKVPLESYKESIKTGEDGLPRRYIDPSAVLLGFGFERGSGSMEYAQYELVCFALDNDLKIYDANSHRAPITPVDYLFELAAASPGLLRRYLDNQFGNAGSPPLSLLMRIAELEDARGLLRLCGVFRDKEYDELDKILQAVSVLQRMQAPDYVYQGNDFSSLRPLLSYYRLAEIKACLSPILGDQFTEYLVREAIVLVRRDPIALRGLASDLRNNERVVLAAVKQDFLALEYADASLKGDKDFMLAAVGQNYRVFLCAGASLKGDKDVMLAVVRQNGYCLEEASDDLKRDKEVVLAAVERDFWALRYADASLKGDKDVMLAVVRQNGCYLEKASDDLKRDRGVVLAAVGQSVWALRYADASLKGDKDVMLAVVRQNGYYLEEASDDLKRDKEVVLAAVRKNGLALEYASDDLKRDRGVVLAAVRKNGLALEYASDDLKRDRGVVLAAVRQRGLAFGDASRDLQKDHEVMFVALTMNSLEYIQLIEMNVDDLLAHLKAKIISTLPERYRVRARELLETKAHISSEIPFVLQDEGLSDVFKMAWARRTLTPVDILAYRENLSKLLAMNVILRLCSGDIHSEKFAELCTKENIDSLSMSIEHGLADLDIEALGDIYCGIEEAVGISAVIHLSLMHSLAQFLSPVFSIPGSVYNWLMGMVVGEYVEPQATAPPSAAAPPLTQFVHDRLATAAHGEREGVVIPGIEFSEGFFRSYTQEHAQEHAPQERQAASHM